MAKHTITHTCGHEQTYQLYGPGRERERKILWLEGKACSECERKDRAEVHQQQNAAAEQWAGQQGLPVLTGTEKQCAWAETIRQKELKDISSLLERTKRFFSEEGQAYLGEILAGGAGRLVEMGAFADWLEETETDLRASVRDDLLVYRAITWLVGQSEAKWWIDNRYKGWRELVRLHVEAPQRLAQEEAERARLAAKTLAEQQAREDAQRQAWERKDKIARALHALLNTEGQLVYGLTVWESPLGEKRVYLNGRKESVVTYYHTGSSRQRPGTLQLSPRVEAILGDRRGDLLSLLAEVAKAWRGLKVGIGEDGAAC